MIASTVASAKTAKSALSGVSGSSSDSSSRRGASCSPRVRRAGKSSKLARRSALSQSCSAWRRRRTNRALSDCRSCVGAARRAYRGEEREAARGEAGVLEQREEELEEERALRGCGEAGKRDSLSGCFFDTMRLTWLAASLSSEPTAGSTVRWWEQRRSSTCSSSR